MELCRAYDLNPLLQLELQHAFTSCHSNSFINPRQNKEQRLQVTKTAYESQFINVSIRDKVKLEKLRVVKVVHAFIHRRMFIFYQKPQMFSDLSKMLVDTFNFKQMAMNVTMSADTTQDQEFLEPLVCSDVLFALLNYVLNQTEPIVYGFTRESRKFNTDIGMRRENERMEVITRACIAKEMTIELQQEIGNKKELLEQMIEQSHFHGVNLHENALKTRHLICRLDVQVSMMKKSAMIIDLALEKFAQQIDNSIQKYNKDLNNVMKLFTFIAISFLPQVVVGSLWGMNCPVPFMTTLDPEKDTINAWLGIVGTACFFTVIAFGYFKHVKYI